MKNKNLILLAFLAILVIGAGIMTTISQVTLSAFEGNAYIGGVPAQVGKIVSAWITTVEYGTVQCGSYTIENEGIYIIAVSQNGAGAGEIPGCGTEGKTVVFKIEGIDATPNGTWHANTYQYDFNIFAGAAPPPCSPGADCTSCPIGWFNATRNALGDHDSCMAPYNNCVRKSNPAGVYDQTCCGGTINNVFLIP